MNQCLPLTTQGAGACESVSASHHTGKEDVNQCLPLTTQGAGACESVSASHHTGKEHVNQCLPLTMQGAGACESVSASHHTGKEDVNQCLPLTTQGAGACESVSASHRTSAILTFQAAVCRTLCVFPGLSAMAFLTTFPDLKIPSLCLVFKHQEILCKVSGTGLG